MPNHVKRPRDPNQLAKLVVDIATGEVSDDNKSGKDQTAAARGRLGGQKGGAARARTLPKERRIEIAKAAARARWTKDDS